MTASEIGGNSVVSRFLKLGFCQAVGKALGCGECHCQLLDGKPGFDKCRRKELIKGLANGSSSNVARVEFPVDKEVLAQTVTWRHTAFRWETWCCSFSVYGGCCRLEDGVEHVMGIASVEEVSMESSHR